MGHIVYSMFILVLKRLFVICTIIIASELLSKQTVPKLIYTPFQENTYCRWIAVTLVYTVHKKTCCVLNIYIQYTITIAMQLIF